MAKGFSTEIDGSVEHWTDDMREKIADGTSKSMLQAAELAAGAIRAEIFSGSFRPGTGALARSFTAALLAPKQGELRSAALSDSVYARIQDKGGTIKPKNAKALTIPISANAKQLSARGIGARDFPTDLSLIWPKGKDRGVLVSEQGVEYSLRKSVTLPARNYIAEAAKRAEPQIAQLIGESTVESAEKAKAK